MTVLGRAPAVPHARRAGLAVDRQALRTQLRAVGRRRRDRPRIVLVGNFGNGNTGDESLLAAVLQELGGDVETRVLCRSVRQVEAMHGVPAVPLSATQVVAAVAWCDGLVVVGAGMFGRGMPATVGMVPPVALAAQAAGRDVAYVGLGLYDGVPAVVGRLLRASMERASVTVRDRASTARTPAGTECIGDLAFLLEPAGERRAELALAGAGLRGRRPLCLLSLKALPDEAAVEVALEAAAAAGRRWLDRGGDVGFLALSSHADYGLGLEVSDPALAHRLRARLGVAELAVLGPGLHPAVARAAVARASAVVGLRFHALVFAAAAGVPCLGFPWEAKSVELAADRPGVALLDGPPARAGDWAAACYPEECA